jgi:hypothetical protein
MPLAQPRKVTVETTKRPASAPLSTKHPPVINHTTRPRDAAIRQAANDNRTFANGNTSQVTRDLTHPTVDEQFTYSYQQQGLQPSVGTVTPYRNTQIEVTYNQSPVLTPQFQNTPQPKEEKGSTAAKAAGTVTHSLTSKQSVSTNPRKALMKNLPGGFAEGELKTIADKLFVTEATIMVAPAAGTVWFTLQLPLAIVALVMLGIASAFDSFEETIRSNALGNIIWKIGEFIIDTVGAASEALLGFDFTALTPDSFFMLANGLTMLIGWLTLLIIGFVFLFFGISPLFGKGSGAKITALIMSMVFYALPVFNLLPWFGLWVFAVWLYPTEE